MLRGSPSIISIFGRRWIDPLSALRPDENITVFGWVKKIAPFTLTLDRCEFRGVSFV
jgi:hypothetical protein